MILLNIGNIHLATVAERDCVPVRDNFIPCITELVQDENSIVLRDHYKLLGLMVLKEYMIPLDREDGTWMKDKMENYQADDPRALLEKMYPIPVRIAVAQAILESGWGMSDLAKRYNSFFGQIGSYRFENARDSVISYIHNLNTHSAYQEMRRARAQGRSDEELVDHMKSYSTSGSSYLEQIKRIMRDLK